MRKLLRLAGFLAVATSMNPAAVSKPLEWGNSLLQQPADWYGTMLAREAAGRVLAYQSDVGAWPKNTDLLAPVTAAVLADIQKEGKADTIDNNATTRPIRFLALVATATGGKAYKDAVLRGVDYLLSSQYANGGFPQFYPLRTGYYSHITYNDDAMINALEVLRDVAESRAPYRFVDAARRERAGDAVKRGIAVILQTQVRQDGKLTAWCAQHDEVTLEPAWARAYEPPSLSGDESVGVVEFLMSIDSPSPGIVSAIDSAVAWFRSVEMHGQRLEAVKRDDGRTERILVPDPAAPPLWARFYELGTNRPLYMDRDSKPHYAYSEIGYERRSGYNYNGTWPARLLEHDYPEWRSRVTAGQSPQGSSPGPG